MVTKVSVVLVNDLGQANVVHTGELDLNPAKPITAIAEGMIQILRDAVATAEKNYAEATEGLNSDAG